MSLFTKFAPLVAVLLSAVSVSASTLTVLARHSQQVELESRRQPAVKVALPPVQQAPTGVALNVFPNPSQGTVTVTLTDEVTGPAYKMRLRNIIGQDVRTVALHPQFTGVGLTLDLSLQ
jgi:hypothetical protein